MFGLPEEVGGQKGRVGCLVGDDGDLGGSGQEVYAHPPEELTLGFGDIGIAGPDYHVDRLNLLHAEGDRGQGLHPADTQYLVGPRYLPRHRGPWPR